MTRVDYNVNREYVPGKGKRIVMIRTHYAPRSILHWYRKEAK